MPNDSPSSADKSLRRRPSPGQTLLRLRLFVSSYMLLFVLLGIRFENTSLRIACGIFAAVGLEEGWRVTRMAARRKTSYPYEVQAVEDAGPLVSGFLASYLLPFLVSPRPTTADIIAYAVFFAVAWLIASKSDLAHVNPTLYLLGRRVVRITTRGGSFTLISDQTPLPGDKIMAARISGGLVEAEGVG